MDQYLDMNALKLEDITLAVLLQTIGIKSPYMDADIILLAVSSLFMLGIKIIKLLLIV